MIYIFNLKFAVNLLYRVSLFIPIRTSPNSKASIKFTVSIDCKCHSAITNSSFDKMNEFIIPALAHCK